MVAARYNAGLSNNQFECDIFTMELRSALVPSSILFSANGTLSTTGMSSFQIPVSLLGNSYYVVVHHRNSIETWSKFPVTFSGNPVTYDFTTP
jgi:hypothetical protein